MANVAHEIERGARAHPDRTALVERDAAGTERSLTYAGLVRRAARLSAALAASGVGRGDRVLLLVPMGLDLYVSILAAVRMGAVCVFVDPHMGARRFDACCAATSPKAFIGVPRAHVLRLLCASLRKVPVQLSSGRLPWPLRFLARDLAAAEASGAGPGAGDAALPTVADTRPDEPALVTFTTGSSGAPKGSNRTHGFLEGQLAALDAPEKRACASDFPGFPILPLEDLARGRIVYLPRIAPGKVREADPDVLLAQLDRHRPAMMSGSPAYLEALADGALARGRTLDMVELLYTGGAPITAEGLAKLRAVWRRARIQVVYGSTEAEPVAVLDAGEALTDGRAGAARGLGCCVGYPVEAISVIILPLSHSASEAGDLAAEALPAGAVGQIVVRGRHVNTTYWNDPEAERANKIRTPTGTWHRMGDAGYLDGRGRLWIAGRVHTAMANPAAAAAADDESAAYAGEVLPAHRWPHLFPYQAELAAEAFPEVRKSAYLESRGRFHLVVEAKNGAAADPAAREDLARRLRGALAGLPLDAVDFHPALPVDPRHNSKVEYAEVKAWLLRKASP